MAIIGAQNPQKVDPSKVGDGTVAAGTAAKSVASGLLNKEPITTVIGAESKDSQGSSSSVGSKDTQGTQNDESTQPDNEQRIGQPNGHHESLRARLQHAHASFHRFYVDLMSAFIRCIKWPWFQKGLICTLIGLISFVSPPTHSAIAEVVRPICSKPAASWVPVCRLLLDSHSDLPELIGIHSKLGPVLEGVSSNGNLAMDFKVQERALSDLSTLVSVSNLKVKHTLVDELEGFIKSARMAGRSVVSLEYETKGTANTLLAMDEHVINSLARLEARTWSPWSSKPEAELLRLFNDAMCLTERELSHLMRISEANMIILNKMDTNLRTIHKITSQSEGDTKLELEEALPQLWSGLGGNAARKENFESHIKLLSEVAASRLAATLLVDNTLIQVNGLQEEVTALRTKVAKSLLPGQEGVPLKVVLKSVRAGVQTLIEGRIRANQVGDRVLQRNLEGPQHPELAS